MPTEELPLDEQGETASSKLVDGLKSCRTIVADYRAALTGDPAPATANPELDEPAGEAGTSL